MTLARELSTDEQNPKNKTLRDIREGGTTAWVGGLPYELAVDKTALHDLLSEHGGDLQAITVRVKPPAVSGLNKSWCFATFRNDDAVQRLQAVASTADSSVPRMVLEPNVRQDAHQPSSQPEHEDEVPTPLVANEDVEYKFDNDSPLQSPISDASSVAGATLRPVTPPHATAAGTSDILSLESSWPPTIIVKKADVEKTLFTRKLEAIFAGRLNGMKMDRGLLSKNNTSVGHLAQVHKSVQGVAQPITKLAQRSPVPRRRADN